MILIRGLFFSFFLMTNIKTESIQRKYVNFSEVYVILFSIYKKRNTIILVYKKIKQYLSIKIELHRSILV